MEGDGRAGRVKAEGFVTVGVVRFDRDRDGWGEPTKVR